MNIPFIIGLIVVVLTMVYAFLLVIINESKKPRNKVHFYVSCEKIYYRDEMVYTLWIGKPYYTEHRRFKSNVWGRALAVNASFALYNLNYSDFADMKNGEIREVFVNLED